MCNKSLKFHDRIRLTIQGIATLIQNANFKGFINGTIYEGDSKKVCVPGLNCYSCPGAIGSCPVGSVQNFLTSYKLRIPYYILGFLFFFGAILGRLICGFLCPFGLIQDLINKIPFPKKIRTFKGDRILRLLKYVILIVFVIVLPILCRFTPAFCKYICPSGTLSGLLLAASDTRLFELFGSQFAWKMCILGIIVLSGIIIYRPFCKYLCPLGAFYAPFNKVSLLNMKCDKEKCTSCNACASVCNMNVNPSVSPNSLECIRCGRCIKACPTKALHY